MARNMALTPRQRRAVQALLEEKTIQDAATASQVPRRTLHRWLAEDPVFLAHLRQQEAALDDQAARRLLDAQQPALDVLVRLLLDPEVPDRVKHRVAVDILNLRRQLLDRSIEDRLLRLEAHLPG